MAHTAMCSGEGGILPEEMEAADKYIFEYVGNLYSVTPENLQKADAIEIKIGQGTKPGMGGHLPGEKVTKEISEIRNKQMCIRDRILTVRYEKKEKTVSGYKRTVTVLSLIHIFSRNGDS